MTAPTARKVECPDCAWRGQRVYREDDVGMFGNCPKCGGILQQTTTQKRQAEGRAGVPMSDLEAELLAALKECAFRLATLIAASGDFSDVNAHALDAASTAIAKAEGYRSSPKEPVIHG